MQLFWHAGALCWFPTRRTVGRHPHPRGRGAAGGVGGAAGGGLDVSPRLHANATKTSWFLVLV